MENKAHKVKICSDPKCREEWMKLDPAVREAAAGFNYCPFCAEELSVTCSSCQETITETSFRFCPWCGCGFD